jgi:hypothetical protein
LAQFRPNFRKDSPRLANNKRALAAKVAIRRSVAEAVGAPVHVFDAFAGAGELYRDVWRDAAASYTGCDKRYFRDGRRVFVADNRRVLRAIDLAPFNVFDLDAYGCPWEQAVIIAARRKFAEGERVGIVVTEGNGANYKNGVVPVAVRSLTGLKHFATPGAAMNRSRDSIQARIWSGLAARMNARVERLWKAQGTTGAMVAYMGAVLVGNRLNEALTGSAQALGAEEKAA